MKSIKGVYGTKEEAQTRIRIRGDEHPKFTELNDLACSKVTI